MSAAGTGDAARFLLCERDTHPLVAPLGLSGKIKYTCVGLSSHYLALGANTGGVYCFHRDYRYIQLLANKEGSVSQVRFSPDEQFLAVVAGGGTLLLWELHLSGSGVCKRLHECGLLRDAVIRDLVWDGRGGRVFFGDSQGRVAAASLPKVAMKSGLFRKPNEIIFQDKSPVVQLDLHGDMLLVSTHSRAVLLRLSSASKSAVQVGKKSRDGPFGACFDVRHRDRKMVVYSARPGGRLWEADVQGEVQATVKLRGLFTSSPTTILGHGFTPTFLSTLPPSHPPSLPLPYLYTLHNGHHLVTWDDAGLCVWQPSSWQLAAWTTDLPGIVGVACEGGRRDRVTVCALVEGGRKVLVVTLATLMQCIQCLVQENLLEQVTTLLCAHMEEAVALLPSHPPLHSSLSTFLQHTLTHSALLPAELQTLQSELDKISREREERGREREREGEREERGGEREREKEMNKISSNDKEREVGSEVACSGVAGRLTVQPSHHGSEAGGAGVESVVDREEGPERGQEEAGVGEEETDGGGPLAVTLDPPTGWEREEGGPAGLLMEPVPLTTNLSALLSLTIPPAFSDDQPTHHGNHDRVSDDGAAGHVTSHFQSCDKPDVCGRSHRRSNSWSGVPEHVMTADTVLASDVHKNIFQGGDEGVWLSGSHTLSHLSTEGLNLEVSRDQLSLFLESPAGVTLTGVSPWQQTSGVPDSQELHSGDTLLSVEREEGEGEGKRERKVHIRRNMSMPLANPSHIAMATLLDHDSDDVIAVPVRSSAPTTSETVSKSRSKRRSRRSKKSASVSSLPATLPSTLSVEGGGHSLIHVPEETILPFPDAGLPTPDSPPPSPPHTTADDGHQIGESDSVHTLQRGSSFVSKMKELARQGGHNMGLEADSLQGVLQQPVRKVKELLTSLAAPAPTALSIPASAPQTVFMNEDYVIPQPLQAEYPLPTNVVDQSDDGNVSRDLSPTSQPHTEGDNIQKSLLANITMETLHSLSLPDVYCTTGGLKAVLTGWLATLETAVGSNSGPLSEDSVSIILQCVEETTVVDLLTLAVEVGVYGSEGDLVPFLGRYFRVLHGVRTMSVLGMQEWRVRGEGWRVLVERGGGQRERERVCKAEAIKKLTNQNARASDLPTYLNSLVTSDLEALAGVCVEAWPAVKPWHVALLCCTDQSYLVAESCDRALMDVYANYLTLLLGDSGDVREEVGSDEEMVLASLEMLLSCGPALEQLADERGRPRAWSHKCSWPHSSLLGSLVDMCVTMTTAHLTQATSACERYGHWVGVAQLAAAGGDRRKSLLIILSLRDAGLLQANQKWGNLLVTVSDWQAALQYVADPASHVTHSMDHMADPASHVTHSMDHMTDPNSHVTDNGALVDSHGDQLTMSGLVYQLVASVGPSLAAHILASVGGVRGGASGGESAEVHSLMVQLAAVHAQQKTVARSLLEKVDRYLWSRQPSALSPQLQLLEEREREGRRSSAGGVQAEDLIQTDMEWRPTLEDSTRHWGVKVVGGGRAECGVCLSPLSAPVSGQQPALLFFHCGHAFHRHCAPEMACHICFKKNIMDNCLAQAI